MSLTDADAAASVDLRLKRDGIAVDAEERARLIDLVPVAQEWMQQITFEETRYAEPALTHPLT